MPKEAWRDREEAQSKYYKYPFLLVNNGVARRILQLLLGLNAIEKLMSGNCR
jgi:hypothetical protein